MFQPRYFSFACRITQFGCPVRSPLTLPLRASLPHSQRGSPNEISPGGWRSGRAARVDKREQARRSRWRRQFSGGGRQSKQPFAVGADVEESGEQRVSARVQRHTGCPPSTRLGAQQRLWFQHRRPAARSGRHGGRRAVWYCTRQAHPAARHMRSTELMGG